MKKAANKRETKKVIGFVVEGTSDANFVNYLVSEYFENKFKEVIISTSGNAAMTSSFKIITSSLLNKGVDHIFVIFDVDELPVKQHLKYLNKELEEQGNSKYVSLIPINPFLETWLLYAFLDDVNNIKKMKKQDQFDKIESLGFNRKPLRFKTKEIDFSRMKRNEEFNDFIEKIEQII